MFREFYEANIDDKETDKLREELRNMLRQRAVGNQIDEWFAIKDPASGQFNFLRRGRDGRVHSVVSPLLFARCVAIGESGFASWFLPYIFVIYAELNRHGRYLAQARECRESITCKVYHVCRTR